jgi:hypothetical protein
MKMLLRVFIANDIYIVYIDTVIGMNQYYCETNPDLCRNLTRNFWLQAPV